ncbi:MAG: NF038129 family PEP-CTERM protein [Luteolibacter sp.]
MKNLLLSTALFLGLAAASQAALTYTVTLDVTSLVGNTNAPFSLDLQMATGSGNVANSVTISNFQVTGGSFTGSPVAGGSYSGSFDSTLVIDNTAANTYFAQEFTAGTTTITFDVTQTTISEFVGTGTPIPDQFNVFIDDGNTADGYVPTNDPSGGNALLVSTISAGETVQDISTYTSGSPDAGVHVTVSAVPEPTSALLLGLGGLGLFARRRRA